MKPAINCAKFVYIHVYSIFTTDNGYLFKASTSHSVRKFFSFFMGLHYELTECMHTFYGSVLLEVHVALDNHEHVVYPDTCDTQSVKKSL
jgi:hypothetical protein